MATYFAKVAAFSGLVAITCLVVILTKLSLHGGKFLYNPASAIAMAEFFKFSMSVYFHHTSTDQPADSKWSLSSFSPKTLTGYCCLGLIYCINNQLTFFLVTVADPASITLAKSTTPFFTAVFLWVLLNREINKLQWCCILCQMLGLIIVQYDPCLARGVLDNSAYFWLTVALSLTSLSSVVNESLLKGSPVPLNMQNVVLYGFGVIFNVLAFFVSPVSPKGVGFFDGYDFIALSVVFMNSIIGIVITFIYKHLDAIVKNFASSVASAFLIYISAAYFGLKLTLIMVCGTGVLMVTMYIYFAIAPLVATALKEQAQQAASSSSAPNSSVAINVAEDSKPKTPNVFVSRQKSAAMAAALLAVFVLVFVWQLTFSTTRVYVVAAGTSPHQPH